MNTMAFQNLLVLTFEIVQKIVVASIHVIKKSKKIIIWSLPRN